MKRYYHTVQMTNDRNKLPSQNIDDAIDAGLLAIVQKHHLRAFPQLCSVTFLEGSATLLVTVIAEDQEGSDGE